MAPRAFAAAAFGLPWVGAALLVLAALGTEAINGAGNLLFLRAVHTYERVEMTTASAMSCSLLHQRSAHSFVAVQPAIGFVAAGAMMMAAAALSGCMPRRF